MDQRIRIFAQQAIVGGLAGQGYGISAGFGSVAPTIEDDQHNWFWS